MKDFFDFVASFLGLLIWPTVVLIFLLRFDLEIRDLLKRGFRFKFGDKQLETLEQKEEAERILSKQEDDNDKEKEESKKLKDLFEKLYFFERTYRIIFTSQLTILNNAYLSPDGEVSENFAQDTYFETIWKNKETFYPFEKYISFLLSQNKFLIHDEGNHIYKISPLGRDFIGYLRDQKIPLSKGSNLF